MPKTTGDTNIVLRAKALYEQGTSFDRLLPVSLANGATVDSFSVVCARCHGSLRGDLLRGHISGAAGGAMLAEGMAFCHPCNLLTPFRAHIAPSGKTFLLKRLEHVPLFQQEPGSIISIERRRNRSDA